MVLTPGLLPPARRIGFISYGTIRRFKCCIKWRQGKIKRVLSEQVPMEKLSQFPDLCGSAAAVNSLENNEILKNFHVK